MARRNKTSSEGSLDSLLDTLTNVVGILVIMLVVIQLGVESKVKSLEKNFSIAELKEKREKLEELKELMATLGDGQEKAKSNDPFTKIDIEAQRKLLLAMKKKLDAIDKSVTSPDQIKKQIAQRKKSILKIETAISKEEDEIAKIKSLLAKAPARGPDPEAKIVNLPNPQGAPPGATAVNFLCYQGRIYLVDSKVLQNKTLEKMNEVQKHIIQADKFIDCSKLKEVFEKSSVQTTTLRVKINYYSTRKDPYMMIEPIAGKGDDLKRIKSVKSRFRQALFKINRNKNWVRFYVWNDSFDVYLAARNYVAKRKIAAGWIPFNPGSRYTMSIPFPKEIKSQIVCAGYKPRASTPKKPGDPNKPKARKDDVD